MGDTIDANPIAGLREPARAPTRAIVQRQPSPQQQSRPAEPDMPRITPGFCDLASFEFGQRVARMFSTSDLVPDAYKAEVTKGFGQKARTVVNPSAMANCVIALEMAVRLNAAPLMVMQNLHIISGRPSWSAPWIIAEIHASGRYTTEVQFEVTRLGAKVAEYTTSEWSQTENRKISRVTKQKIDDIRCVAWVVSKSTGLRVESPPVTLEMAVQEGWYHRNGSKWVTMPEAMIRYRAASFLGRITVPDRLMGIRETTEVEDIHGTIEATREPDGTWTADVAPDLTSSVASEEAQTVPQITQETVIEVDLGLKEPVKETVAAETAQDQPEHDGPPDSAEWGDME